MTAETRVLATMRQSGADPYIWIVEPTIDHRATYEVGAARFGAAKEWAIDRYGGDCTKIRWHRVDGAWELHGVLS